YRLKKKHIDVHEIGRSMEKYLRFPSTFDGRLSSAKYGPEQGHRVMIGGVYDLVGVWRGKITAATSVERQKTAYIGIADEDGKSKILKAPLSDEALAEYAEFREGYFGRVESGPKELKNEFELFEWLMETQKDRPRDKILAWFSPARDL